MKKGHATILLLAGLLAVKLLFSLVLFNKFDGFTLFEGDECSKVLIGWDTMGHWARPVYNSMWLPLYHWILALGLSLYPKAVIIGPLINTIASSLSVAVIFFLCREVFGESPLVGVFAALMFIFHPLVSVLNVSGFEMPLLHLYVLFGIFAWVKFLSTRAVRWHFFASASFLIASMLRYEGWIVVAIFALLTAREIVAENSLKTRRLLLASLAVAFLFIVFWLWWQKHHFGSGLFFIHRRHAAAYHEDSVLNRMHAGTFTALLVAFRNIAGMFSAPLLIVLSAGIISVVFMRRSRAAKDYVVFGALALGVITGGYAVRIGGSFISKHLALLLVLSFPLMAYAVWCSVRSPARVYYALPIGAALLLYGMNLSWDSYKASGEQQDEYSKQAALTIATLKLPARSKLLIEMRTSADAPHPYLYDSYFILAANPWVVVPDRNPHRYIFLNGREWLDTEHNPSILDLPAATLPAKLKAENIAVVVAIYSKTKEKLQACMKESGETGQYAFFTALEDDAVRRDVEQRLRAIRNDSGTTGFSLTLRKLARLMR